MYSQSIKKLISLFSKLPTVGPRTATRFVFYLIKLSQEELDELANNIKNIKKDIKICSSCFKTFDSSEKSDLCPICLNGSRDKELLCIVEKEIDLTTIENTKTYRGLYFILGGTINLKKDNGIRIDELKKKIENSNFKEIIIATNPTPEGETTALFLERALAPYNKTVTRLGRGLPIGGELEYADNETLESAFKGRK